MEILQKYNDQITNTSAVRNACRDSDTQRRSRVSGGPMRAPEYAS